jgi:hypothetical protein
MWTILLGLIKAYRIRRLDKKITILTNQRAEIRAEQARLTKIYENLVKK